MPTPEHYGALVEQLRVLRNADEGSGHTFTTNIYIATLRRDTPEFIPHLHAKMTELEVAIKTMEAEVRRKEDAERKERCREPAWWDSVARQAPSAPATAPYYKLTIQTLSEDHDGYCTDAEVYKLDPKTSVMYLPTKEWTAKDLTEKNTWDTYLGNHCCCNAMETNTLMGWERIEA